MYMYLRVSTERETKNMLKTKLEAYENALENNNYETTDNAVAIIEISHFLLDKNEEADFDKIVTLCNYIFDDEMLDLEIDCDMLIDAFTTAYNRNKDFVCKMLDEHPTALCKVLAM